MKEKETKEKEVYAVYIWISAEIGKLKREIRENQRLIELLEKNKKDIETKIYINKKRGIK